MQIIDILDIRAFEGDLSASSKPGVLRELVGLHYGSTQASTPMS